MDVLGGHGGMVCVLDELSAMISGQNQYKQKGSDREAWVNLWDGHDARVTRAGKSLTIRGARISLFGGIQPEVFRLVFRGDKGIYCNDGTIFRFLFTYTTDSFFTLTDESWTDENQTIWESTLENAITWAENIISMDEWQPHVLRLTDDARALLFGYRNKIVSEMTQLPMLLRGFIPKTISHILRIAGMSHCIYQFARGLQPGQFLNTEDIFQAISAAELTWGTP